MTYLSVGDMAQAYQLRRHNAEMKTLMNQLTDEMISGARQDTGAAVRGDFTALAGIDRSLAVLDSYAFATTEAAQLVSTMQSALETIQAMGAEIGGTLLSAATSSNPTMVSVTTADARERFLATVGAINTNIAGRHVFSGMAPDRAPLAPAEDILAALTAATTTATDASGVVSAVEAWFNAPPGDGGYLDMAYRGGAPLSPLCTGPGESAALDLTAAHPQIRAALQGLAIAALVSDGALAGDAVERMRLTQAAGEKVIGAETSLVLLRADIGTTEDRLDETATRNSTEIASLKIARDHLVAADPYDTATALEAVQTQIETLYTLTARLSRLSLAEYL